MNPESQRFRNTTLTGQAHHAAILNVPDRACRRPNACLPALSDHFKHSGASVLGKEAAPSSWRVTPLIMAASERCTDADVDEAFVGTFDGLDSGNRLELDDGLQYRRCGFSGWLPFVLRVGGLEGWWWPTCGQ